MAGGRRDEAQGAGGGVEVVGQSWVSDPRAVEGGQHASEEQEGIGGEGGGNGTGGKSFLICNFHLI